MQTIRIDQLKVFVCSNGECFLEVCIISARTRAIAVSGKISVHTTSLRKMQVCFQTFSAPSPDWPTISITYE